jgi:hypothetical protein
VVVKCGDAGSVLDVERLIFGLSIAETGAPALDYRWISTVVEMILEKALELESRSLGKGGTRERWTGS